MALGSIHDSSGLRLTYTPELRDHDMGALEVGVVVTKYHVIPREGVETDIARDDNYDFNLQFTRMLKVEITVYPGDSLITECTYSSMHRDQVTYGGLGTPDEMCQAYFQYYPKFNLAKCDSTPSLFTTVGFAGISNIDFDYDTLELTITAPADMVHMSYEQAMEAVPWTDQMAQTFSQNLMNGFFPHHTRCKATHQSDIDTDVFDQDLPLPHGIRVTREHVCSGRTAQETTPRAGDDSGPATPGAGDGGGSGPATPGAGDGGGSGPATPGAGDGGCSGPATPGAGDGGGAGPATPGAGDGGGSGPATPGAGDGGGSGPGTPGAGDGGGSGPATPGAGDGGGSGPATPGAGDGGDSGPATPGAEDGDGKVMDQQLLKQKMGEALDRQLRALPSGMGLDLAHGVLACMQLH
ncbi:dopamine beta-hydroxylase-like [Branchiostoma lanceolatum]|uniref:dopamine beta-hydroxylase-like n=1 Tax=Branchiostoma lanceolatum TaxID=7740 RepID=UPI003456A9EE